MLLVAVFLPLFSTKFRIFWDVFLETPAPKCRRALPESNSRLVKNSYKMGPPKPTINGFIPSYTHSQPWFFIGFAGAITTL